MTQVKTIHYIFYLSNQYAIIFVRKLKIINRKQYCLDTPLFELNFYIHFSQYFFINFFLYNLHFLKMYKEQMVQRNVIKQTINPQKDSGPFQMS